MLIGSHLRNKGCQTVRSPDLRRILIPRRSPWSQRRSRVIVRVVAPHPNNEFTIDVEDHVENLIPILSLHADLLSSAILRSQIMQLFP